MIYKNDYGSGLWPAGQLGYDIILSWEAWQLGC
jgi:hypothetical protein